jgi:hypothetical protein
VQQVKKTRHLVIIIAVAAIVLGIGAVGAYAGLADDATPPVTKSTVATSYAGDVSFQISSTDAEGVAYIYHRFDKGVAGLHTVATDTVSPSVTITVPTENDTRLAIGTHTVKFWAQDVNGNVEAQTTATFTVSPALTLSSSTTLVAAGKYFTLTGALRPAAASKVIIQAKKPGASAFKDLGASTSDAVGAYSYRYRSSSKGTWSFRAAFTDTKTALSALSPLVKVRIK